MSCGEAITAGEQYKKWTCFDDGSASTNKMHLECFAAHEECATYYGDSEWEYTPYSYQRGSADA